MTPEGKTKAMIRKYLDPLKKSGSLYYFMPAQGQFASKGTPDFIVCFQGKFIGIEAKKEGYKRDDVTALQLLCHEDIKNSGGIVEIISTKDEMDIFHKKYLK